MTDTENLVTEEMEDLLYSQKDFDEYKANLEVEFLEKEDKMKQELQKEAKKATMTELELALSELDEMKQKYQEKENECLIVKQKEEVISLLKEADLDISILDIVYLPLDMESTKEKIAVLKKYTENIKKEIFENCVNPQLPLISKDAPYDAFIEGFETNKL